MGQPFLDILITIIKQYISKLSIDVLITFPCARSLNVTEFIVIRQLSLTI